ncbi:phage tail tape measure protein [Paenibacillus daejeonensis]|uniref:phage tail tape measure protein n=1 Tax=Paenibacillus daejeonensis TaxID=135193 RepID=UPI0003757EE1|nr:phage tail tape measure protein [Paenibacillus daejeonensis]
MAGRGREYEVSFKLDAELESSFKRSFGQAADGLENIDRELRELSRSGNFGKMSREVEQFDREIRNAEKGSRNFGDTLKRVAEYSGAFAIVQGVEDSIKNIGSTILEFDDSMAQLEASTGVSKAEMAEMEQIAKDLYEIPLGEGFADISNSIATVRQVSKLTGDELENMSREAMVFREVFGEDIKESVKASDTMMKNFGITSTESFNLLAQGAQQGLNKSNELLDSANEYAPQFAALGFTANEMFDIFGAGLEAGAFNLDKVGDSVKEFNIRLKDGSDATYDALAELFAPDNIVEWTDALTKGGKKSTQYMELVSKVGNETADIMLGKLKKGGKQASDTFTILGSIMGEGANILEGLSSGSVKGSDAMQMVITKLQEIEDPLARNQIGVALFGTQFEDVEASVIQAMGTARSQFDMTKQTMEEIEAIRFDTIGKDWQSLGRQLMTELVLPIAEDLMPTLERLADWAVDNKDLIKFLALATPAALIGKNALSIASSFFQVENAAGKAGRGVGGANTLLGKFGSTLGFFTNPVGLAVGAVGLLTTGVLAYKKHQEEARDALINMGESLQEANRQYDEVAKKADSTNSLVEEYRRLDDVVRNNTDASRDLTTEQERLAEITAELHALHPNTVTQYEIENGLTREKQDLLKQEVTAEQELARLKREREVLEQERNLPKLEKEISKLQEQSEVLLEQKEALDAAVPAFKDFQAQLQNILKAEPTDERAVQLENLRIKANEVGEAVGKSFAHLGPGMLDGATDDLIARRIAAWDDYISKTEDLATARASYEELYNSQKELIELDLGTTLQQQADNFKNLTTEEQTRFASALQAVSDLNQQMELMPSEKTINFRMVYSQIGGWGPGGPKLDTSIFDRQYADGGYADQASIFGEAGPEMAIPLNNKPRSQRLLDETNRLMGRNPDGSRPDAGAADNYPVYSEVPRELLVQHTLDPQIQELLESSNRPKDFEVQASSAGPLELQVHESPNQRLMEAATQLMESAFSQSQGDAGGTTITFAPVITVPGGSQGDVDRVAQAVQPTYEQFKLYMRRLAQEDRRLSFHG